MQLNHVVILLNENRRKKEREQLDTPINITK